MFLDHQDPTILISNLDDLAGLAMECFGKQLLLLTSSQPQVRSMYSPSAARCSSREPRIHQRPGNVETSTRGSPSPAWGLHEVGRGSSHHVSPADRA